ncbi:MAG: aminotransferase class I/II-fold pyridoxal phosphate-dependent enzyme [Deltaproteobacteria bacterium]|nr:aminotransferase class I/II-fold pyridoxal phosphate-dependent enzyme [Deltaproteobacteria bacterium]
MNLYAERTAMLGTESAFKMGGDIARCEERGMSVIRLNLGEPDFSTAEAINEVAVTEIRRGNSHYTDPQGIPALRECIAEQIARTRGIPADPGRVVVTPGAKAIVAYSVLAYVNSGDEVIYPSPCYPIYESWITFVGARPVPLHLRESQGFRFTASELERLITSRTKLIIINSPSNPTGGVLTGDDLSAMARVIGEQAPAQCRILSDEIYEHIIFDGREHRSVSSCPGMAERTVLLSGHSKSYAMTGWRLGYALLPSRDEALLFRQFNINIFSCVPPFIQEAGREAIENTANLTVVAGMVREFQERRDLVVEGLNRIRGIHCVKPEGAFYVFPNIEGVCENLSVIAAHDALPRELRPLTSPAGLFQMFLLYCHGVATMDRRSFGVIGCEGQHFLRLSTAAGIPDLKEGLVRIERAAADRSGFEAFVREGKNLYLGAP